MTNDTNTLNGALMELGETMANNLVSMGVTSASANDGLTTLAGKILDIAPSVGGITPTTSIDLTSTPSTIFVYDNVLISATVNADYDDTSQTDVDLKGYLQGATVTFTENGAVVGTGVTDTNGVATFTLNSVTSNHTIVASFDGTGTDYNSCSSTLSISPAHDYVLTFSESEYTADSSGDATLTLTLTDNGVAVSNASISVSDGTSSYSCITNSNGVGTVTVNGVGTYTATYSTVIATCTVVTGTLFAPSLDGTENKYQISGTTTISNGVMSGGCGYLSDGWDNTGNWVCTFQAKLMNDGSAVFIVPTTLTRRDYSQLQFTGSYHHSLNTYTNGTQEQEVSISIPVETWVDCSVTKNGSTATVMINNNTYTITWSLLSSLSRITIGVDSWGQTSSIRNIEVNSV